MRYDAVFLDVDGTLLWVDLDVEGYVRDLARYARDGPLTVERARGPVWESLRTHIRENIAYPSEGELAGFRRENARRTADALGLDAPDDVLQAVADRRTLFNPYPESEAVLQELKDLGVPIYALSNWDVALEKVLEGLGRRHYFDGLIVSARVGVEKPDGGIFEEALRVAGVSPGRALHVGNDPVSDVAGAAAAGIAPVLVDRRDIGKVGEAVAVLPDLSGLPGLVVGE